MKFHSFGGIPCILHNWSGGARQPAHGMRISCVEPGPAGSFCPLCVTLEKGPKGLQNDQETCTAVVKRAKVKSYQVLLESRQAKCPLESEFAQGFRMFFHQNGFHLASFLATQNEKKGSFSTFPQFLSRNASIFALKRSITLIRTEI